MNNYLCCPIASNHFLATKFPLRHRHPYVVIVGVADVVGVVVVGADVDGVTFLHHVGACLTCFGTNYCCCSSMVR